MRRTPRQIHLSNLKKMRGTMQFDPEKGGEYLVIRTRKNPRPIDIALLSFMPPGEDYQTTGGWIARRIKMTPEWKTALKIVDLPDKCMRCDGRGEIFGDNDADPSIRKCPACHGSGRAAVIE